MPDESPSRTAFSVKEAVGAGWRFSGKGDHPYVRERNLHDIPSGTAYVSGSPAMERGERRAVDDPHPAAFVVIQVERCLAELSEAHRAYAWRRFVLQEPIWDRRLTDEIVKPLEEAIASPGRGHSVEMEAYLKSAEMEHLREVWRRKKAAQRQKQAS